MLPGSVVKTESDEGATAKHELLLGIRKNKISLDLQKNLHKFSLAVMENHDLHLLKIFRIHAQRR